MPILIEKDEATVVRTADTAPGTFIAIILGLVVVAIIGYMIYAFNSGASSTTDIHNTTIAAPSMPDTSAPAPANQ